MIDSFGEEIDDSYQCEYAEIVLAEFSAKGVVPPSNRRKCRDGMTESHG
jgi:hypothetical protein